MSSWKNWHFSRWWERCWNRPNYMRHTHNGCRKAIIRSHWLRNRLMKYRWTGEPKWILLCRISGLLNFGQIIFELFSVHRDTRNVSKPEFLVQVQLRFCSVDVAPSGEQQDDYFPPNIVVKVNAKLCPLPVCDFLTSAKQTFDNFPNFNPKIKIFAIETCRIQYPRINRMPRRNAHRDR